MKKPNSEVAGAAPQLDDFKIRKVEVNLGNAFVRLAAKDRRKVLALLKRHGYGKTGTISNWDRWSKDDMKCCYQQLQPISQKMANDLRRWASLHLKTERKYRFAIISLAEGFECRRWMEEPSFYIHG